MAVADFEAVAADAVADLEAAAHARCMMQFVQNASSQLRSHSSQTKTDLYIAGNVSRNEDHHNKFNAYLGI